MHCQLIAVTMIIISEFAVKHACLLLLLRITGLSSCKEFSNSLVHD